MRQPVVAGFDSGAVWETFAPVTGPSREQSTFMVVPVVASIVHTARGIRELGGVSSPAALLQVSEAQCATEPQRRLLSVLVTFPVQSAKVKGSCQCSSLMPLCRDANLLL